MASVNKVIIVGNLGRDPELRYLADGNTAVTSLSVATTRRFKGGDGQVKDETEWHRVTFFSRLAEVANEYLRKGSACYVEGRLRTRKYVDKQNIERYVTEIIGESLQLLDKRQDGQQNTQQQAPRQQTAQQRPAQQSAYDDDLPPF